MVVISVLLLFLASALKYQPGPSVGTYIVTNDLRPKLRYMGFLEKVRGY